ncbi:unnamed protein product [Boreogadus saida]
MGTAKAPRVAQAAGSSTTDTLQLHHRWYGLPPAPSSIGLSCCQSCGYRRHRRDVADRGGEGLCVAGNLQYETSPPTEAIPPHIKQTIVDLRRTRTRSVGPLLLLSRFGNLTYLNLTKNDISLEDGAFSHNSTCRSDGPG